MQGGRWMIMRGGRWLDRALGMRGWAVGVYAVYGSRIAWQRALRGVSFRTREIEDGGKQISEELQVSKRMNDSAIGIR